MPTMSVGSTLSMADTAGGSYTVVAGVRNVRWRGTAGSANASALADEIVIKLPKRKDFGDLSCGCFFDKTQFNTLYDLWYSRAKKYFRITTADGSVLGPLYGFVAELGQDVPDNDPIASDLVIAVSGDGSTPPDFVPAA